MTSLPQLVCRISEVLLGGITERFVKKRNGGMMRDGL